MPCKPRCRVAGLAPRGSVFPLRGYTLVELLIVMALVGVVISIGAMNFAAQMPHDNLRHAASAVVSDLRFTRQTAITKGIENAIEFSSGAYVLPKYVKFGLSGGVNKPPSGEESGWNAQVDGVTFHDNTATFKPDGVIKSAGTIFLTNTPFGNETRAITVNFTGRVKAFKWNENAKEWE